MSTSRPGFSHVLITRPRVESDRLASRLAAMNIESIVQPAQEFESLALSTEALEELGDLNSPVLLIFTSPRSVDYGLGQIPRSLLFDARIAAIGPATARALAAAGKPTALQSGDGYTSEALIKLLAGQAEKPAGTALVVCAPGGRQMLMERLPETGWQPRAIHVYERKAAALSEDSVKAITNASKLLTVFTSGEAMNTLSQRLPPAAWYAICRGEWLVISERLQRLARAFGPSAIHLSGGPGNAELATAIRSVF